MSRAKKLIEMLEDGEVIPTDVPKFRVSEAGDPPHTHLIQLNEDNGDGKLTDPSTGEPHDHEVKDWIVQPAGKFPHIHEIIKQELMPPHEEGLGEDKEWNDEVSDTKEKVKVVTPKNAPNVRRVFDKRGKYMGSFDTKKTQDKTKYKTMFKGAK